MSLALSRVPTAVRVASYSPRTSRRRARSVALTPRADASQTDALLACARVGDAAGVRCALDAGADPNARDADGGTATMLAAGFGASADAVAVLVDAGANLEARDRQDWTAALYASFVLCESTLSTLICTCS